VPLSEPVARKPMHTRQIVLHGYQRTDGLFDIEVQLTDTKPYGFANEDRGFIEAGQPLHGMFMRMTVDEDLLITGFEAVTDHAPYTVCPQAADNFSALVGIRIKRGFVRAAAERVGGTHGCTHLRELLQQMATTAFQTTYPVRAKRARPASDATRSAAPPALLNSCLAYSSNSPVIQRRWPEHYTGPV
jgi:hypothetical protein